MRRLYAVLINVYMFLIGGFVYCLLEVVTRRRSHISMYLAGGLCFVVIGYVDERLGEKHGKIMKMFVSALIITMVEFIIGLVVNVWLRLNVWDYKDMPFNIMGQICPVFTLLWFVVSYGALGLNKVIRPVFIRNFNKWKYQSNAQ